MLRAHSADAVDMRKSLQGSKLRNSFRGQQQASGMQQMGPAAAAHTAGALPAAASTAFRFSRSGGFAPELDSSRASVNFQAMQGACGPPSAVSTAAAYGVSVQSSSLSLPDLQYLHQQVAAAGKCPVSACTSEADCCRSVTAESLPEHSEFSFNSSLHSAPASVRGGFSCQQLQDEPEAAAEDLGHSYIAGSAEQQKQWQSTAAAAADSSSRGSPGQQLMQRLESKALGMLGQRRLSSSNPQEQQASAIQDYLLLLHTSQSSTSEITMQQKAHRSQILQP